MKLDKENEICFGEDERYRYLRINSDVFIFKKNCIKDNFLLYENLTQDQIDTLQAYLNGRCSTWHQIKLSNGDLKLQENTTLKDIEQMLTGVTTITKFSILNFYSVRNSDKLSQSLNLVLSEENSNKLNCKIPSDGKSIAEYNKKHIAALCSLSSLSLDDNTWRVFIPAMFPSLSNSDLKQIDVIYYTQNACKENYRVFICNREGKKFLEVYKAPENTSPFNWSIFNFSNQIFSIDMQDLTTSSFSMCDVYDYNRRFVLKYFLKINDQNEILIQSKSNKTFKVNFNNSCKSVSEIRLSADIDKLNQLMEDIKGCNSFNNKKINNENNKKPQDCEEINNILVANEKSDKKKELDNTNIDIQKREINNDLNNFNNENSNPKSEKKSQNSGFCNIFNWCNCCNFEEEEKGNLNMNNGETKSNNNINASRKTIKKG